MLFCLSMLSSCDERPEQRRTSMDLGGWSELNQPTMVQHQDQVGDVHAEVAVPSSKGGDAPHSHPDELHDLFPVQNIKTGGDLV